MKQLSIALILCCVVPLPMKAQESWIIQWEGLGRLCLVDFPSSRSGQTGLPVVFDLHGYGSSAAEQRYFTQIHLLGDSAGFITVHPDAYSQRWNSGIGDNQWWPTLNVDDVGFISKIIDSLISRFAIDTQRVYSCGLSNGGFMSIKLAAQLSNRIAAVASVSGVLANSTADGYSAKRPIPLLMIHGTDDLIIPFDGGQIGWYSVEETIGFWRAKNSCYLPPDTLALPDLDRTDQSTVVQYTYRSSSNASKVKLLKVIHGGHTWPGESQLPTEFGTTNNDIKANNEIWNFFKQFTKRMDAVTEMKTRPTMFFLSQNYPNPFNPSTTIRYELPQTSHVTLSVFDMLGRQVAMLVNEKKEAGVQEIRFDGSNLASGVYFYRLQAGAFVETRKSLLLH
jgi:polyhydroxybutyrate depolymerase